MGQNCQSTRITESMNPDRLLVPLNNAFIGTRNGPSHITYLLGDFITTEEWFASNSKHYTFSSPVSLSFSSSYSKGILSHLHGTLRMAHGKRSSHPRSHPFPIFVSGGGDSRARASDLLGWSLSHSNLASSLSFCGGGGRPMRRTAIRGCSWLAVARLSSAWAGGTQSANQSISFAVLMLRMVSRIRSTSAKEDQINLRARRLCKVTGYN